MLSAKQRLQKQMGGGRKPQGKGLMSQFHCDNAARVAAIVAIVRLHSVQQLTRKPSAIDLDLQGLLTDKEVSLAMLCCEGPQPPRQLPLASFKHETGLSTNHIMTF